MRKSLALALILFAPILTFASISESGEFYGDLYMQGGSVYGGDSGGLYVSPVLDGLDPGVVVNVTGSDLENSSIVVEGSQDNFTTTVFREEIDLGSSEGLHSLNNSVSVEYHRYILNLSEKAQVGNVRFQNPDQNIGWGPWFLAMFLILLSIISIYRWDGSINE